MRTHPPHLAAMAPALVGAACHAAPAFVNAFVIDVQTPDALGGIAVNDGVLHAYRASAALLGGYVAPHHTPLR